jgi:hypothetical protein
MKIEIELTEQQYKAILAVLPKTTYLTVEEFCEEQIETGLSILEDMDDPSLYDIK